MGKMKRSYNLLTTLLLMGLLLSACNYPGNQLPNQPTAGGASVGSISGVVWLDQCASPGEGQPTPSTAPAGCVPGPQGNYVANGVKDNGESGIAGVTVSLGAGGCPSSGLATATTDAQGAYIFNNLQAGTYCLSIDPSSGGNSQALQAGNWTYPAVGLNTQVVSLQAGQQANELNFGWSSQFQAVPSPSTVPTSAATAAPSEAPTEIPTAEPTAEPTSAPAACTYLATFVKDVTIADNSLVAAGSAFVKTWRVRNDGSCTWGPGGFALVFTGGDHLGGPDQVPISSSVAPGQTIDVSVSLVAPGQSGTYTSDWMLTMDGLPADLGPYLGVGTGNQPLFARIIVGSATALDSVTQVHFASGATAAVIDDSAKAGSVKGYRLRALAGQILMATLTSNPNNARLSIFAADGRSLQVTTTSDKSYLLAYLPTNQNYTVVVTAGSQKVNYSLEILIPSRISFAVGAFSDSVNGTISNHLPTSYILRAGKGQTMTVKVTSPDDVALTIYGLTDGEPLVRAGGAGVSEWSGKLPATQDYIVQVVPAVDSTTFTLKVTIK
jgi:Ig-like domain from next to BRCA1 gene/SdrD B-like domain